MKHLWESVFYTGRVVIVRSALFLFYFNGATIESSITIIVDVSGLLLNIQYNLQVNKAPIGDIFFSYKDKANTRL